MKYLVVSLENHCVYTSDENPLIVNALANGDGDTTIRCISQFTTPEYNSIANETRDFFLDNIYMISPKTKGSLVSIPKENISDSWKNQQQVIRLRQELFYIWDAHITNALLKVTRHKFSEFDQIALQELSRCSPTDNSFTPMIEEYATILNQPIHEAFRELKLRIESDNMIKFRIQCMANKWRDKINQVYSAEERNSTLFNMFRDFWGNANL